MHVAGAVSGRICLADGSIASVRTDRVPLVSSLAAAISEVGLDAADHHLDSEHYSHLRRLAFAHTGTPLVGSWLDNAARIRICRNGRHNYRIASAQATGCISMLIGPGGIKLRDTRFVNPKARGSNPQHQPSIH
jgi:hypothetical protein